MWAAKPSVTAALFLSGLVFILAVGFEQASAAGNASTDYPNQYLRKDTQGKFTNLSIADKELREQSRYLDQLNRTPISDDSAIKELIRRRNELPPVFLYELARRVFPRDKNAAVEWYFLGYVRARLDAVLCTDRTAPQGILYLPRRAPAVVLYIRDNPKIAGEIAFKVLKRDDLMASTVSPWWICSHGINAFGPALQGKDPKTAQWLKPESEWPGLHEKVLAGFEKLAQRLTEPLDDPVERLALRHEPRKIASDKFFRTALWIDDESVALLAGSKKVKDPAEFTVWKVSGKTETISKSVQYDFVCTAGGRVSFVYQRSEGGVDDGDPITYQYRYGKPGKLKKKTLVTKGRLQRPLFQQSRFEHNNYGEWRQSPFDCHWMLEPSLNEKFGDTRYWSDLGEGRGFIGIIGKPGELARGTYYMKGLDAAPVRIADTNYQLYCMKYVAFRDSILMTACPRWHSSKSDAEKVTARWLTVQNGSANITEETLPALPNERDQAQLLVTKRGYVRLLERRHTVVGTKPGGLYLYDRNGKPRKIWEGYPVVADVSPSGCGIVFVAERQAQTPFGGANDVFEVDICKGIPD